MWPSWRSSGIAGLLSALAIGAAGQAVPQDAIDKGLQQYREMMRADPWANPAMLDADRGESLWRTRRGPRNATLEQCDLGKGPGLVDGAFAELPRHFPDARRVMDLEARLVWCMDVLQGLAVADIVRRPYPAAGQPTSELGALATFVASRSAGRTFAPRQVLPQEREALALGEALFFRRQGPMDFACASCHDAAGKRIRRQELAQLTKAEEARKVLGEWPAYRVSSAHTMTMQHRIYDCFWQMRLPEVTLGSDVTVALVMYLAKQAEGGTIAAPGIKR